MDSNTYDSERCVVCLEGITNLLYFFTPCLHQCICEACAVEYNSQQDEENFNVCPVCRSQYLSIEFDESKFLELQQNREPADTASAQQLWTTFESNLQEMMLNLNGLKQDVSSAPSELQDRLSAAIQQIEELTLVTTQRSDDPHEEQSQPAQDIVVPGPSSASPRATTITSVRDLVRQFEANDAIEENAAASSCSRRTVVPWTRPSGAVPRTTTTSAESTREMEEDPDENDYWDDDFTDPITTGLTDSQTYNHLPITVILHETISLYLTDDESTRTWSPVIKGQISLRYPTNPLFTFDGNLKGRDLTFRLLNAAGMLFTEKKDKSIFMVPSDEEFPVVRLLDLVPLMLKALKPDRGSAADAYLTSTIMEYLAPELDGCGYCPLDLTVHWNIQGTLVTQLLIKYRYNPAAVSLQATLHSLQITVAMIAGFKDYDAEPMAKRIGDKLIWKLPSLTPECADTYRTLTAEIHFSPSIIHPKGYIKSNRKGKVSAQFVGQGKLLSGIDLSLHGTRYTVQCTTKQFAAGEYVCVGETVYS